MPTRRWLTRQGRSAQSQRTQGSGNTTILDPGCVKTRSVVELPRAFSKGVDEAVRRGRGPRTEHPVFRMPGRLDRRENPVRVIDVLVDELDLAAGGFSGVDPEATGRPSYHPAVLLKLYIYRYLNRVQSSRRLEREAGRNVEVMWLTGRLVPDHKTIADFRKDNGRAMVVLLLLGINVLSRSDQWWFDLSRRRPHGDRPGHLSRGSGSAGGKGPALTASRAARLRDARAWLDDQAQTIEEGRRGTRAPLPATIAPVPSA